MKNIQLSTMVATALFLSVGLSFAGDAHELNTSTQNLSKRPYQEAPQNKATSQKGGFDGATLVNEEGAASKPAVSKHRQLRINMLGSRPYIEDVR